MGATARQEYNVHGVFKLQGTSVLHGGIQKPAEVLAYCVSRTAAHSQTATHVALALPPKEQRTAKGEQLVHLGRIHSITGLFGHIEPSVDAAISPAPGQRIKPLKGKGRASILTDNGKTLKVWLDHADKLLKPRDFQSLIQSAKLQYTES